MNIFGTIDLNTVTDPEGEWHLTLATEPATRLTLDQARSLARILREVSYDPAALHRAPTPEPTFCEEDKVL